MQIPPATALLNLVAALPAQGAAAAPSIAKPSAKPAPLAAAPHPQANPAVDGRQPPGSLPRGSIINIVA
jgi:hypothetical protein